MTWPLGQCKLHLSLVLKLSRLVDGLMHWCGTVWTIPREHVAGGWQFWKVLLVPQNCDISQYLSGWWFGTCFSIYWEIRKTTNQLFWRVNLLSSVVSAVAWIILSAYAYPWTQNVNPWPFTILPQRVFLVAKNLTVSEHGVPFLPYKIWCETSSNSILYIPNNKYHKLAIMMYIKQSFS